MDQKTLAISDLELIAQVLKEHVRHHHGHAVGYLGSGSDPGYHQLQDERLTMVLEKVRAEMSNRRG